MSINFKTREKKYLRVTLADENETTLLVCAPTKGIMDALVGLADAFKRVDDADEENIALIYDELYGACARVLSRNKGGIKVSKKDLEDMLDFEDITDLFSAYMEFVGEITSAKN